MVNYKRYWPSEVSNPRTFLERLRKSTTTWATTPGQHSNPEHWEYKPEVVTTRQPCSVKTACCLQVIHSVAASKGTQQRRNFETGTKQRAQAFLCHAKRVKSDLSVWKQHSAGFQVRLGSRIKSHVTTVRLFGTVHHHDQSNVLNRK